MEATAVSLARSVLDGVLSSAGSAVADEVARLLGVPKEVEFIRNELEMMQSFLRMASAHPEATGRNDTVKTWVKQVRDLAYHVEDCLLDFALYAATSSSSRVRSWLPGVLNTRHRIAERIRYLKASVEELNQRNLRYHIVIDHPHRVEEQAMLPDHDVHLAELAFLESDIIGRKSDKDELTRVISGSNGALSVLSVWGMGGIGKSSLMRLVRNDPVLLDKFDCGAWVTVPHPLDSANEFSERLRKHLGVAKGQDVRGYLQEKRYVIIVDDLLSQEEWEHIRQVLPFDNNKGSHVIVTTRYKDVAERCLHLANGHGQVYELKPLADAESKDLLCRKVYRTTEYTLPEDMETHADRILRRCRGLPLAISTIGGLLANRPKTGRQWKNLHEHLGAELESDQLRDITKVITSSYGGLPYYLKSIFLYLSIFPENWEIKRTRLLRRWMAEGYIAKNHDMPVEDVAERFYNELINRSMIQSSRVSSSLKVDRCRVHGMVLKIILSKSIEENQLFLIEKHCNEVPQSKIRHLVVNRWNRRDEKLENIELSLIRSLTVFGECPSSLISPKMRLLRVLDLEDTDNLNNDDLKHIGKLRHLRYLCLRGTKISKLPSSLQNLRYLETLDIQDTPVTQLPVGIAKLEKLRYLLAGVNFSKDLLQKMAESGTDNHKASLLGKMGACLCCNRGEYCNISRVDQLMAPEGIEKLRNLHMLGVVHLGQSNGVAGRFKELTNLRKLGVSVTGLTVEEGEELCKSVGKLNRLEVRSKSLQFLNMDESAAPKDLVSLRLCGHLGSLPEWIGSVAKDLAKVKLLGTQLEQDALKPLENLRNLALLGLWQKSYVGNSLHFGAGTFPKLKFLDIDGLEKIERVAIEDGAMPELEQLSVYNCEELCDSRDGLSGVPYLLNLNELSLKKCGEKNELEKILQKQVSRHRKRPKFLIGKSIPTNQEPTTSAGTEK